MRHMTDTIQEHRRLVTYKNQFEIEKRHYPALYTLCGCCGRRVSDNEWPLCDSCCEWADVMMDKEYSE